MTAISSVSVAECEEILQKCIKKGIEVIPYGDERYPENAYVQYCSTSNVTLIGTYDFSWDEEYPYLSDEDLAYRGVGVGDNGLYFNYYDCDGLVCTHL